LPVENSLAVFFALTFSLLTVETYYRSMSADDFKGKNP
jgi:hypothetical protein